MRRTTIAHVTSSKNSLIKYPVILRGGRWECQCAAFFFSGDRNAPCRHIKSVRTLDRVEPGQPVLKKVQLTSNGEKILKAWRTRQGMPFLKPEKKVRSK